MITILHRGEGFLGTPKSDYVICARPLKVKKNNSSLCLPKGEKLDIKEGPMLGGLVGADRLRTRRWTSVWITKRKMQ